MEASLLGQCSIASIAAYEHEYGFSFRRPNLVCHCIIIHISFLPFVFEVEVVVGVGRKQGYMFFKFCVECIKIVSL